MQIRCKIEARKFKIRNRNGFQIGSKSIKNSMQQSTEKSMNLRSKHPSKIEPWSAKDRPMGSGRLFLEAPCPNILSRGSILRLRKSTKSIHKSIPKSMPKKYGTMIAKSSENCAKMAGKWMNEITCSRKVNFAKIIFLQMQNHMF